MDSTHSTPKKWHDPFLRKLSQSPNVAAACRTARIDRSTAYLERGNSPEFAAAWDEAREMGLDSLEDKAIQRAEKVSDTLMIFLLKAHRPAVYNQPQRHALGGDPNAPPIRSEQVNIYLPDNGRSAADGDDAEGSEPSAPE
jgi:hypothetical protein